MKKVVVTGGSGRAGEYIIAELAAHGYEVHNVDAVPPRPGSASTAAQFWRIDSEQANRRFHFLSPAKARARRSTPLPPIFDDVIVESLLMSIFVVVGLILNVY